MQDTQYNTSTLFNVIKACTWEEYNVLALGTKLQETWKQIWGESTEQQKKF